MRLKRSELKEHLGFSMTPMIDVVFQLIIFFMLVTDFIQIDLEWLRLPVALAAIEDNHPDPDRLVINIHHESTIPCDELQYDQDGKLLNYCRDEAHWKIKIKGKEVDLEDLTKELRLEGDKDRIASNGLSDRAVMLRSDAGAPYRIIQKVLEICSCKRVRIWKLEIGATKHVEEIKSNEQPR